tara:strand:+ start:250 stop:1077 length:828 start_codon:yes stop_codon:yes gene_type:complete
MELHHHEKFTGIFDLMAAIDHRNAKAGASSTHNGADWAPQTLKEAEVIANNGGADFDTADKMMAVKTLTDAAMTDALYLPNWTPSVAGFLPSVPAYCAGEPLSMFDQSESVLETAKVLKIAVVCIPCSEVTATAMLNRGAAILGAIDALERDGNIRVELVGMFPSYSVGAKNCLMEMTLKNAGDDWNPASVAFAIANPAFGRRIGFRWLESKQAYAGNVERCYGHGSTKNNKAPIECDIYLPYLEQDAGYTTPNLAVESISNTFSNQLDQLDHAA